MTVSRARETVVIEFVDARVGPRGSLENLSQAEIDKLLDTSQGGLYPLFRRCALAVLNSGAATDNAKEIFDRYRDFEIQIVRHAWGIKLEMQNAPAAAFVDGEMIRGIKEHLFAVLRDVIYISNEIIGERPLRPHRLRLDHQCRVPHPAQRAPARPQGAPEPRGVLGRPLDRAREYQYTKNVGYELGLRGLDVCTGCGPGAMKGPMKGATIGHAKQRIAHGRYIGITEPGIIAAEPPNPIVTQLVDHAGHREAPGGLRAPGARHRGVPGRRGHGRGDPLPARHPAGSGQRGQPLPVVLTGPRASAAYFEHIARFIAGTLGKQAAQRLTRHHRRSAGSGAPHGARHGAGARVPPPAQRLLQFQLAAVDPARVPAALRGHARVDARAASCNRGQPVHELAANLRRAFSGIVTGNVKEYGIQAIERYGPYEISGDPSIMGLLDELLAAFVAQKRMKLPGSIYRPCTAWSERDARLHNAPSSRVLTFRARAREMRAACAHQRHACEPVPARRRRTYVVSVQIFRSFR